MLPLNRFSLAMSLAATVFAAGLVAPPRVQADDIEVFFSTALPSSAKPNVLFILDSSQSMYTLESSAPPLPYNPATEYPKQAGCEPDQYYWTTGGGTFPTCGAAGWKSLTYGQFECPTWRGQVDAGGFFTKTNRVAQGSGTTWKNLTQFNSQESLGTVCQGETSVSAPSNWTAKSKGKDLYPLASYTFFSGNWLNWAAQSSGDKYRIDLVREAVGEIIANTDGIKVGLMRYGYDGARKFKQNTATACENEPDMNGDGVLDSLDEATLSSNGAPVIFPVTDLDGSALPGFNMPGDSRPGETDVRKQLRYQLGLNDKNEVIGWVVDPSVAPADQPFQVAYGGGSTCPVPLFTPGGRSPIGGAMMEAYLYYSGSQWSQKYGKQAAFGSTFNYPSVEQSRIGDSEIYKSPIVDSCAKNFVILLSDGTTEQDNDVDGPIQKLPGFEAKIGSKSCDAEDYLTGTPPPSSCVDDMAEYMLETDMRPNNIVAGLNNVITYTIGFKLGTDTSSNAARQLLQETAQRGGGSFYEAGNAVELKDKLGQITREILTANTSFSAPAVTVNAFNRTQNLNDLYMSLFRPAFNYRWQGNIKKYQLDPLDGDILDAAGNPAVDPGSGFFFATARSFWSASADGADITAGGASGLIEYDSRTVKTHSAASKTTTQELNSVAAAVTAADLGIQTGDYVKPGVAASGDLTEANLVEWIYGKDIADANANGVTAESRYEMGDPLHARPVTVIYGSGGSLDDDALFAVTNDGVLHAFDPDSDSPSEMWAYIPRSQLGRSRDLYYNATVAQPEDRGYGFDGNIRVMRIDNNRNGIIEPGGTENDKVYLFFGQRRGGSSYFAFDVTTKTAPKLMWERDYTAAGDGSAGESWSVPTPARVRVGNTVKNVLIFGGGYDTTQDAIPYAEDTVGRGVYMVDALTGDLLWRAGPDAGAKLQLTAMTHSIPGDVRVIDLTGDGFADRMYAADLGGRVWRFDIFNGNNLTDTAEGSRFIEGGLLASLGNAEQSSPKTQSNTIRFFYAPDPALITQPGPNFINVAIGSGHRELPATDKTVVNWMFSIRDYNVLTPLLSSWYKADCSVVTDPVTPCHQVIDEDDLVDLTDTVGADATTAVPVGPGGAVGWRIAMEEEGEKVLAEARTFQNSIFFTTYSPVTTGLTSDACGTTFGLNKLYIVNALDARPTYNYDDTVDGETPADRSKDLAQGSIAPEVVFIFPTPPVDPNNPNAAQPAVPPVCLVGLENCGFGISNPPVRTYWRQRGANQ
jgi:type IV pilus assembly protein PilY1